MKLRADCNTIPVAINDSPRTPIHTAVRPGPTKLSTESVSDDTALRPIAAPVANSPKPGSPNTTVSYTHLTLPTILRV